MSAIRQRHSRVLDALPERRGTLHSVLASLTVGGATLRRDGAVSYAKNSARDLRHGPIVAQVPVLQGDTFQPPTVNDASTISWAPVGPILLNLTVRRMPLPVRVVPRHWWVPVRGGLTHNLTDLRSSF